MEKAHFACTSMGFHCRTAKFSWWDPTIKYHCQMLIKTSKMIIFSTKNEYRADGTMMGRGYVLCCNFFVFKDTELSFAEHVVQNRIFITCCHICFDSSASPPLSSKRRVFLLSNPKKWTLAGKSMNAYFNRALGPRNFDEKISQ